MSRGPGRVERAITTAFTAEPMRVFTTEDLCKHAYRHLSKIEKKHRVSLIRAARKVLQRECSWRMVRTQLPGAPLIFFNEEWAKQNPTLKNFVSHEHTGSDCEGDKRKLAERQDSVEVNAAGKCLLGIAAEATLDV